MVFVVSSLFVVFIIQVTKYAIQNPLIEDSIYTQYLDWSIQDQDGLDYFWPFVNINTDEAFACPTDVQARAHAMAGNPVYLYQVLICNFIFHRMHTILDKRFWSALASSR